MVESALEFLRICNKNDFDQVVLSMKSSNPLVMVHAYRLLVKKMDEENMHFPLHLGVGQEVVVLRTIVWGYFWAGVLEDEGSCLLEQV